MSYTLGFNGQPSRAQARRHAAAREHQRDAARGRRNTQAAPAPLGPQFTTCFTGTKVQILTPEGLRNTQAAPAPLGPHFTCFTVNSIKATHTSCPHTSR
jgi:hypothetical protein